MDSEFIVRRGMINKHKEYTANEISLDKEFSLSPGQSIMIAGEDLAIKFIEVISDGRCPKGAICVWAGEARCLTEITTYSESSYHKVLNQPRPFRTIENQFR